MACTLRFPDSNVAKALRKLTGSNDRLYASYLAKTVKGGELTKDFVEWYQTRHPHAKEVSTDASEGVARNIAKGMMEYYNYFVPDGRTTIRERKDIKSALYGSVADRNFGKRVSAGIMLRGYNQFANVKHDSKKLQTREDYENFVEGSLRQVILKNIANKGGLSYDNIRKEYLRLKKKEGPGAAYNYIMSLTQGMELSIQEENQLAMLQEILTDTKAYFDEVLKDSRLANLVFKQPKDDTSNDEKAAMNAEAAQEETDDDATEDYFDESFRVFDSHDGIFKTFEMHVGGNIRNYFNGLKKLRSTAVTKKIVKAKDGTESAINVYDEDTNNPVGLADNMTASQCVAVMYSSASYASVDSMIESVRRIANTQPGMEAFIKFADDLAANRDFACEVYRTFAKNVIAKTEVVLEGGEMKVRISNIAANKLDALRMEFVNTSRYNAISVDGEQINTLIDTISRKVSDFKKKTYRPNQSIQRDTDIAGICKDLADALKMYYPTIDESTIINYVYGKQVGGRVDEGNNIIALGKILRDTVAASKKTLKAFRTKQYETAQARRHNEQVQEMALQEGHAVKQKDLKDIPSIWADDYLDAKQQEVALALATELVNYSVVKIELNSRNVEGNLSSDVINSSFITNFINTLSSELNAEKSQNTPLAQFGNWKLGGHQYNLSNILVEEKDDNGRIVNYGLFTKTGDGVYVPTPYATELISISLFNGASDRNQGKNVLYSKMSTGDYIATAMSSFFNDERKSTKVGAKFASYFMRTPSDAPKNFLVSAPRYFTENLIKSDGTFNRNHIVFNQYRRLIRQELTNAVHALEYMFKVTNGIVELDNEGKPVLNDNIKNMKDPKHNLYKQYHYIDNILEKVTKDGHEYWTLTGNVFKSTKLTYVDDAGVVHNFMDGLISDSPQTEGIINFLYGGVQGNPLTLDTSGNVIISKELQDMIDARIEQFITALVNDGVNRISKFEDLLEDIPHDKKDIQDFMINYHLMYNNFDDLFEGDSKFYGTAQDFLKRAKEVQASGVPYANEESAKFGNIYNGERRLVTTSILESDDWKAIVSNPKLHDLHIYDKFRGVTVKNTIKQDPMTMPDGILSQQLQNAGLTRDEANKMMNGYAKTKVNDAQSYITLEEWIRRITLRGQAYQYKPLIEALLDESKPLTVSDIQQFIQVQKNFYYDHYKDPKTGIIVPRQIKNAEFVLVPRFIKGTELEQVYNAMVEAKIDQLNTEETSKAGKARVLTLWNEDGVLDKKAIDTFKEEAKRDFELFDYKHLYTQQETPQHVAAENKAGIQIMKKILDNIDENSSEKLKVLKRNFTTAFCQNIQDSYEQLCAEVGIELDENGNIQLDDNGRIKGLDYSKLSEKFIDELNRLGANSQMYDFVEIDPTKQVPVMPSYLNSIYYKIQNISQSIFNNGITRQKLPGFHAAQITQVGFRPFSEKVNKRVYDSALQYHPQLFEDAEGNEIPEREYVKLSAEEQKKYKKGRVAPYIEIMLPKANFGLSHLSDEEALAQLKAAGVDEIIGYRIPTEGKQSICVMKVVGFTDDALGSTIVVPDGWVAQTGSDFDIDSVYGIHWETYFDKNGKLHKVDSNTSDRESYDNFVLSKLRELDPESVEYIKNQSEREADDISAEEAHAEYEKAIDTSAKENNLPTFKEYQKTTIRRRNRAARNNVMLNSMIGILQDPAMLEENLSRSNSDDLEDALDNVLPQTFKNRRLGRSPYNFLDQADYQSDVMSGAALKGFSVTRDTMCSVSNAVKPTLDDDNALFVKYLNGRKVKHNRFGWSEKGEYGNKQANKNIEGKLITVYSSETTAFILDAVKKGAIPNVNDLTFSTFKTFVDLGSTYDLAVAFMGQPAITRIVEAYHKGNSIYSQDSKKPVDEAIMSIARDLGYKKEKITVRKALEFINSNKDFIEKVNKYLGRENQALTGRPDDIERTFIDEAKLTSRINETGEFSRPVEEIGDTQQISRVQQYDGIWTRNSVSADKNTLYIFTDNTDRTSGSGSIPDDSWYARRYGIGHNYPNQTTAVIRGLENSRPISTVKWFYRNHPGVSHPAYNRNSEALWHDKDFDEFKSVIDAEFDDIIKEWNTGKYSRIMFPDGDGLFNAKISDISENRTPRLYTYLQSKYNELISLVNSTSPDKLKQTENVNINNLAFDLATILTYNKISKMANQLTNVAMILNPDKFGAKQTIYATRKVFDDIADIIINDRCPLKVTRNGKRISMVEAIYPGVVVGTNDGYRQASLDRFLKTKGQSAYPSLYTFLKYATAPSIKVNQTLFKTQEDYFVDAIKSISAVFSGKSTKVSEDLYNDVERYYLGFIYNQLETLRCPTDYIKGQGFRNKVVDGRRKDGKPKTDEEIRKETALLESEERARVFGFNRTADLAIEVNDEAGEAYLKPFTVKDINNPTQNELFDFAKLSPAQKLAWVQQNFRDSVVCEYFRADLSNRRNTYNTQSVRYIENNVDIETVFQDFLDTFNNDNPLLAMTAMDLIKYAFVAEGFRMSKGAVNKTIHNAVLYNSMGLEGSGIVSQLTEKMADPAKTLSPATVDELTRRYVRAHMNMKEISHSFLKFDETNGKYKDGKLVAPPVVKKLGNGVYRVEDADTIVRKNIGYREFNSTDGREDIKFNKFVTLSQNKATTLYEIYPVGETCFLIPLNKLEANETTEWSANIANNKFAKREFYISFIEEQIGLGFEPSRFMTSLAEEIKTNPNVTFQKPKRVNIKEYTKDFDINDARSYTNETKFVPAVKQAISMIRDYFASGTAKTYYFQNMGLSDIIKEENYGASREGGTVQVIDGQLYHLYKVKHKPEGAERAGWYIAVDPINRPASDQLGVSVEEKSAQLQYDITREARQIGTEESKTFARQVENEGIRPTKDSASAHMDTLLSSIGQYLTHKVDTLLNGENGVNTFTRDTETGQIIPMNDSRIGEMLRTNPALRRQFIKNILDAKALIDKYKEYVEFDITSNDIALKANLDKIKDAVKLLENNPVIKEAEEIYVNEYLKKISKNPLIKNDIISILDGYHSTSAIEAFVHDLQETGSPLIQTITKDVMSDIRAREMKAQKDVSAFRKSWEDLEAKAKANGRTLNINKIIDDAGRIIKDYSDDFKQEFERLRDEVETAKEVNGLGSIEHLKAKLAYDKFILQNCNQELPDDFYAQRIALEENMITRFPAVYSKYKRLSYELSEILSHTINGELDPAYEARRVAVNKEIQNLRNTVIVHQDGSFTMKGEVTNPNATPDQIANSLSSANALYDFIKARRELTEQYYEYTDKFGFDELLERNKDIIAEKEADAAAGRIDLRTDEVYKRAKEWMHKNTRIVYDFGTGYTQRDITNAEAENIINDTNNPNLPLKALAALKWLYDSEFDTKKQTRLTTMYAKQHEAYDNAGVVDARKFSNEEIARIKKEQEDKAKGRRQGILDEGSIISSVPADDTIYNKKFWEKVSSHGMPNQDYLKVVKDINDVLRKAYDKRTGILRTSLLTEEEISEILTHMEKLGYKNSEFNYKDKNRIKRSKGVSRKQAKATQEFIKNYCESNPNMEAFRVEEAAALAEGAAYYRKWCDLNYEWVEGEDGFYKKVPNRLLWGGIKLKDNVSEDVKKEYIDVTRTNAMRVIKEVYDTKPTEYYYEAYKEALKKGDDYFNDWFDRNHTYNTFTHQFEPIECWMQRTPNDNFPGHYESSFNAQERNPIETNKYYRDGLGHLANYKTKNQREEMKNAPLGEDEEIPLGGRQLHIPDGTYDNPVQLNPEEEDLKKLIEATLAGLAHTKQAKEYFSRGNMPSKGKGEEHDAAFWIKDFLKHFGIVEGHSGKDVFNEKLGEYENDIIPDMPMTHLLHTKDGEKEIEAKYKLKEPNKNDAKYQDGTANYEEDLKAYKEEQKQIKAIREREHKKVLDRDWKSVMEDFILKAAHYNAVQDNKYALYMGQELLKKIGVYQTKYSSTGQLKVDKLRSNEDQGEVNYLTQPDKNLQEQYQNWIRRLVFDQFKKQQGWRTNMMSRLQAFTSTNYMTMNIRGGIANVTLGESTIIGEYLAKEFLGPKEWAKGKAIWSSGVTSYILGMNKDTSTTLADAICKAFNVVDFDEIRGVPYKLDLAGWNEKIRDLAFSPQTAGEHFMQNGMLFSMMLSHRLVPNPNPKGAAYVIMSEMEYTREVEQNVLMDILENDETKKEQYQKYLAKIKSDANIARKYAWWREDVVGSFVNAFLNRDEQAAYAKKVKDARKKAKAKFQGYNDLYSQIELGKDGKMAFKANSDLAKMDVIKPGQDISDAWAALGEFKSKVISVNKYIHGVYDKMGAAMMEREWYGAIVMQYHKHIPMGIARFYRRQGYFNEERGNVNKGIFASIKDFLTMNVRAMKTRAMLSEEEVSTIEGLQELFKTSIDFMIHAKTCYDILPEYEKANLRRSLGYVAGIMSAVCLAIALRCIWDDDDPSIVYNMGLYEADRLASEAWQFTPIGMYTEAKKLFSQPIAAQSIISDTLNAMGLAANYIINGEDADLYFQSGRFANQNKIGVYVERRIPIWRNIKSITDIAENNHYYKLGDNMLSMIPVKDIAKWIKE